DLLELVSDPEGDEITVTADALPDGLSLADGLVFGVPSASTATDTIFRWTDIYGDYYEEPLSWSISPFDGSGTAMATPTFFTTFKRDIQNGTIDIDDDTLILDLSNHSGLAASDAILAHIDTITEQHGF